MADPEGTVDPKIDSYWDNVAEYGQPCGDIHPRKDGEG